MQVFEIKHLHFVWYPVDYLFSNQFMEDKGYYAQFIAGRNDDILYTKSETLGQSLEWRPSGGGSRCRRYSFIPFRTS